MPTYQLTYFNGKGRAELIRLIFHASGTKFTDKRIEGTDWPALKPTIPNGTLPVLEVDGEVIGQSLAIARYVAGQTGLAGKSDKEKVRADVIVENTRDLVESFYKILLEKDETVKATLKKKYAEETVPLYLERLSQVLKSNGGNFFVGTSLTWADLAVFNSFEILDGMAPAALDKHPDLKTFRKRIGELPKLSAYLKARPKSDL